MKDLPHHIKKLNRRVIRSIHYEQMEDENYDAKIPSPPVYKETKQELKKIAKCQVRKEKKSRTPIHLSAEEKNQKMKHRVPIFDRNNAKPRVSKPTKKKTPRI